MTSSISGDGRQPAPAPERTRTVRELFTSRYAALAIGVLLLEFAAGVTVYVSAAVVPSVIADLDAAREYPLIVSATSVGLFGSLAVAARLLRRIGARAVLAVGLVATVAGAVCSAVAGSALLFAVGRLVASLGSGLLGVFGTAAVIATVPNAYRIRLLALTSAMWIVPGMVGPAGAVAVLHAIGWRWTLLLVLPLVLLARILVGRAGLRAMSGAAAGDSGGASGPGGTGGSGGSGDTGGTGGADRAQTASGAGGSGGDEPSGTPARRDPPLLLSLLLPAGMALFVFGSAGPLASWSLIGLAVATVGAIALLPRGTVRLHDGPPRFLALLAVVSFGYFGADSLMTAIGNRADGLPLMWVSVALGASAVCWSLTSILQPRLSGSHGQHSGPVMVSGVVVMAAGAATLVALQATGWVNGPSLLATWSVVGGGMGLAYPIVYFRATTAGRWDAAALATAVLVAESTGSMLGAAAGSAIVDGAQRVGATEAAGLHAAMIAFAAVLVLAVGVALRGRADRPTPTVRSRAEGSVPATADPGSAGS